MIPKCSACGAHLDEGEVFCSNCGKKQEPTPTLPDVVVDGPAAVTAEHSQPILLPTSESDLETFDVYWDFGRSGTLVDGFVNPFHFQINAHKKATTIQVVLQLFDGETFCQQISSMRPGRSRKTAITIPDNRLKPVHGMQCDLFFSYVDDQDGTWHGYHSQDIVVDVVSINMGSENININVGDINIGSGNTTDRAADSHTNIQVEKMDLLGPLGDIASPGALIEKLRNQKSDWQAITFFEISEQEFPDMVRHSKSEVVTTPLKQLTFTRNGRQLHVLAGDMWRFGRATTNDVCLRKHEPGMSQDEFVRVNRRFSSTHFTVMTINGEVSLIDGNVHEGQVVPSTNGVQIGGFNVGTAPLGKLGEIVVAPSSNTADELHVSYRRVESNAYLFERADIAQPQRFLLVTQDVNLEAIDGFSDLPITIRLAETGLIVRRSGQTVTGLDALCDGDLAVGTYTPSTS